MGPLATLPVFLRLDGQRAVLAGASDAALWKAELIAAAGADLHVFAEDFGPAFVELRNAPPAGRVTLHRRGWTPGDLSGAAIAVADIEHADEAARFVEAAREAGATWNVIDRPAFCAFQFGAIVNRSPLVVAISTDGAAPVFGQAVRARIEAILPAALARWAQAARDWRPAVQARRLALTARRRFWESFARRALAEPARAPVDADRDALLADLDRVANAPARGRVLLVGAGPGDPELLTLRAVRALQAADVILFDDLVCEAVLDLGRREARRIRVGKRGHGPSCRQSEICDLVVALAREGKTVVRLKSGDPGVFGRASEELAACRAAGVEASIVPGVSAAQGAAASLGLSLTERATARRVQFVTGHGQDGALPRDLDWSAIADPKATTAIYMPRRSLAEFRDGALAAGLPAQTPAVAIVNATRPDEISVAAPIGDLPERLARARIEGPMLVIVGAVAGAVRAADDGAGGPSRPF
ncbi:MAG: uroporphyrinogen-III C-methyltransferase [Rhizobiales bacterium]|nr:uroporphyrinogen-III C-methyltransferase [Hyphomicrobiales bacterium]